jgi:hypothetical protein
MAIEVVISRDRRSETLNLMKTSKPVATGRFCGERSLTRTAVDPAARLKKVTREARKK